MDAQEAFWRELGPWPRWGPRAKPGPTPVSTDVPPILEQVAPTAQGSALSQDIEACTRCALHEKRQRPAPGLIQPGTPWMFIGEAPGAEEDQQGLPFVGSAGKLLDRMLLALGLQRGLDASIANVVKCRPPHNRTPSEEECQRCLPYLHQQIAVVNPRIIVLLGRVAAHNLLSTQGSMGTLRGRLHHIGNIPAIVTWHPAYLLRSPQEKAGAWADLCLARRQVTK